MTIFKKLPGSLSLQRGTVVSDGAFFLIYLKMVNKSRYM